jgi:hypothetical protein
MFHMFVRNRVADFSEWKRVFYSHAEGHREAGLRLIHLWQSIEDEDNVFFLFEVADIEKARAFVTAPEGRQAGNAAGVMEGEIHFLRVTEGY